MLLYIAIRASSHGSGARCLLVAAAHAAADVGHRAWLPCANARRPSVCRRDSSSLVPISKRRHRQLNARKAGIGNGFALQGGAPAGRRGSRTRTAQRSGGWTRQRKVRALRAAAAHLPPPTRRHPAAAACGRLPTCHPACRVRSAAACALEPVTARAAGPHPTWLCTRAPEQSNRQPSWGRAVRPQRSRRRCCGWVLCSTSWAAPCWCSSQQRCGAWWVLCARTARRKGRSSPACCLLSVTACRASPGEAPVATTQFCP